MRLFFSVLTLFVAASLAHAETVIYHGIFNGRPAILNLNMSLPAPIIRTISSPFYDPEYQREMGGGESINATVGMATLTTNGQVHTSPIYGIGVQEISGLKFVFDAALPGDASAGFLLDGFLFNMGDVQTVLNTPQNSIESIQFPASFSVHWYGTGRVYQVGVVQFVKQ